MTVRGKIRVLVVDDSAVMRRLVTAALASDPQLEVVGIAENGRIAQERVEQLRPEAVTMDIEMPDMNGIEAVKALRRTHPRLPIVMFSTLTERGASATLDALSAGASDYVTKPSNTGSFAESQANVRDQLIPKLKALVGARRAALAGAMRPIPPATPRTVAPTVIAHGTPPVDALAVVRHGAPAQALPVHQRSGRRTFSALVIGCSTGGPDALAQVLPALPADLSVPVLVVQHMPPLFTKLLAQRLDDLSRISVTEAVDGEQVLPGRALIAPGGKHLTLHTSGGKVVVRLNEDPPEHFCRPAVDVLFRSASAIYGDRLLGSVLTGMGKDGAAGAATIRAAGGEIVVQDEATSVVWGMPGAVAALGQADRVVALTQVGPELAGLLGPARMAVTT
jgi:two-component system, chemotaxis family, protein-glutamate methylesterase/glutaminase